MKFTRLHDFHHLKIHQTRLVNLGWNSLHYCKPQLRITEARNLTVSSRKTCVCFWISKMNDGRWPTFVQKYYLVMTAACILRVKQHKYSLGIINWLRNSSTQAAPDHQIRKWEPAYVVLTSLTIYLWWIAAVKAVYDWVEQANIELPREVKQVLRRLIIQNDRHCDSQLPFNRFTRVGCRMPFRETVPDTSAVLPLNCGVRISQQQLT